jgi:hypothetical protein
MLHSHLRKSNRRLNIYPNFICIREERHWTEYASFQYSWRYSWSPPALTSCSTSERNSFLYTEPKSKGFELSVVTAFIPPRMPSESAMSWQTGKDESASAAPSIYSLLLLDGIRVPPCICHGFGCVETAEGPMQQVEVQRKCCAMTKYVSRKHKHYECASKVFRVSTMAIYVEHSAGKWY